MLLGVGTLLALKLISSHHKNGSRIVSDQRTIQVVAYLSVKRINRDIRSLLLVPVHNTPQCMIPFERAASRPFGI
jgi:hypothetical protein